MEYWHDNHVAHRALKPQNRPLLSEDDDSTVRSADAWFAKTVVTQWSVVMTQCGTRDYVAPEILEGTPYSTRADMWSMGVISYIRIVRLSTIHGKRQSTRFVSKGSTR